MKIGVIDVGGGLRGVYAAGVFDRFIEEDIHFDVCIGVSAGSANCASFLAGQKGRNYPFYTEYPFRKEYMSVRNLLHKGCYLDLNYIYSELSNAGGENPLDCAALLGSQSDYYAVATNAVTGEARYFTKNDISQDHIAMYFTKDDENSTAEDEAKAAELIQAITQAAKTGQFTPEMEGMVEELNGLKAVIKDKKKQAVRFREKYKTNGRNHDNDRGTQGHADSV